MFDFIALFQLAMWATLVSAGLAASWLFHRARSESLLLPLAGFCAAMALWCSGHLLAHQGHHKWAIVLLLANPLLPSFFLHFVVKWLSPALGWPKALLKMVPLLYLSALLVWIASVLWQGGYVAPWEGFNGFFHLSTAGWINLSYTIVIGMFAHVLLLYGFNRLKGNDRRSIFAMFLAGGWGFTLATSFIFPSLEVDKLPVMMLALPSYAILLVYAVVRYKLVEVNRWASKGLFWLGILTASVLLITLPMVLLSPLGLDELAHVPMEQLLIYSAALLLVAAIIYGPAKNFADRLVYPGAVLSEHTRQNWIRALNNVDSWQALTDKAEQLWLAQTKTRAVVLLEQQAQAQASFLCIKQQQWQVKCLHQQHWPPALQHMAEVFVSILTPACESLDRSLALAEAQKTQLEQAHLAELGGLTAAIAHELRNPLNIIAMASTQCDESTRGYIKAQIERAELLIKDLLSYSGQITLNPARISMKSACEQVRAQIAHLHKKNIVLQCERDIEAEIDAQKIQQVLINLLENAVAFVASDGEILIDLVAHKNEVEIRVHNNGPAISPHIQQQLFQPFVSKRAGGSGLGLAIIKRIVDAHQGQVYHSQALGWPVSFVVRLPLRSKL